MADTVAGVNLEQVGRTDSNQGPQVGRAHRYWLRFLERH